MKVLVTGSAGFIGSALSIRLLDRSDEVVGIDNHNDYYSQELKEDRVKRNYLYPSYSHFRINLNNKVDLEKLFNEFEFDAVVNLAAQAGVRYSLENPMAYVDSNIIGFINILEACKNNKKL